MLPADQGWTIYPMTSCVRCGRRRAVRWFFADSPPVRLSYLGKRPMLANKATDTALKGIQAWDDTVYIYHRETPDLDLLAFELSLANTATRRFVERIPFPEIGLRTEDRQPIVEFNIRCHNTKKLCAFAAKQTNRAPDD